MAQFSTTEGPVRLWFAGALIRSSLLIAGLASVATAKHFPGLGAATASENTDEGPVTINLSKGTLRQGDDEYPYQAAISANVDLVMVSWAKYPNLGSSSPAGLSAPIVQGELRGRLHFHGLTITDAIGAGALAAFGSSRNRALLAAKAGMQLILASDSLSQDAVPRSARGRRQERQPPDCCLPGNSDEILMLRASLKP